MINDLALQSPLSSSHWNYVDDEEYQRLSRGCYIFPTIQSWHHLSVFTATQHEPKPKEVQGDGDLHSPN